MKIAILQMDVKMAQNFADCEQNFIRARGLIDRALKRGADVAVLPEAFNTGFNTAKFKELADTNATHTKKFLNEISRKSCAILIGGSISSERDKIYNSAFVYQNGAEILRYDKIHAFSLARENEIVSGGDRLGICEIKFKNRALKIGVAVCYDLRFCELFRALALRGAQIVFVIAQFVQSRIEHFITLAKARAIENQIFICAVNGCGDTGQGESFGGNSMLINPYGEIVARLGKKEAVKIARADLNEILKFRAKMDFLKDMKPEIYKEF
ncbi:nitrilase-related carbon-nitrogen hydrolase [uncultured Campylobacter sp.]|uniref:nitrilase-related carbon-nitrogen hydrolase n=1 Tax=uncultured Campylobacter sp. TaxID=218934 RepID=UPI002630E34E|nr:nitrilase-related carbon-nitrogen hydrolase [uncultured Campylobacter sp.]